MEVRIAPEIPLMPDVEDHKYTLTLVVKHEGSLTVTQCYECSSDDNEGSFIQGRNNNNAHRHEFSKKISLNSGTYTIEWKLNWNDLKPLFAKDKLCQISNKEYGTDPMYNVEQNSGVYSFHWKTNEMYFLLEIICLYMKFVMGIL